MPPTPILPTGSALRRVVTQQHDTQAHRPRLDQLERGGVFGVDVRPGPATARNPPLRFSSGPPFPCTTPSTETCVVGVSFMIVVPFSLGFSYGAPLVGGLSLFLRTALPRSCTCGGDPPGEWTTPLPLGHRKGGAPLAEASFTQSAHPSYLSSLKGYACRRQTKNWRIFMPSLGVACSHLGSINACDGIAWSVCAEPNCPVAHRRYWSRELRSSVISQYLG